MSVVNEILAEIDEHIREEGRPLERLVVTPQKFDKLLIELWSRGQRPDGTPASGLPGHAKIKDVIINHGRVSCRIVKGP